MNFPDPNSVNYDDIIAVIDAFCNEHIDLSCGIMPGYEFEHVVFDDCNLENCYVASCIARAYSGWFEEKIKEAPQDSIDSDASEDQTWKRWAYDAIMQYRRDALSLLGWLLMIPEDKRIEWVEE